MEEILQSAERLLATYSLNVVGAWQARREPAKGQPIGLAPRANTPPKRQRQGTRGATTLPRPRPASPLSQPAAA